MLVYIIKWRFTWKKYINMTHFIGLFTQSHRWSMNTLGVLVSCTVWQLWAVFRRVNVQNVEMHITAVGNCVCTALRPRPPERLWRTTQVPLWDSWVTLAKNRDVMEVYLLKCGATKRTFLCWLRKSQCFIICSTYKVSADRMHFHGVRFTKSMKLLELCKPLPTVCSSKIRNYA